MHGRRHLFEVVQGERREEGRGFVWTGVRLYDPALELAKWHTKVEPATNLDPEEPWTECIRREEDFIDFVVKGEERERYFMKGCGKGTMMFESMAWDPITRREHHVTAVKPWMQEVYNRINLVNRIYSPLVQQCYQAN
ncbi:hypothetical protein DFP72DRAFT_1166910 [Ephemerocybe angulata]|uniref:Uncharacterized protein n=1 Tax=Ephemerocybe angulata TaxID=980116 RepID=A0A8H6M930_9AGAR|nr:hypothetical protein DFP72DRAFT_1166910 [Tulosesus angulatus]